MRDDYYVYTYAYPESMGGAMFYVGKGTGNRINFHESEARNGGTSPKCVTIRQIWDAGEQVVKQKVYEHLPSDEAARQERLLIRQHKPGDLTNRNRGDGRPKVLIGEYVTIALPVRKDLLAKIDSSGKSRREYIETLLEQ